MSSKITIDLENRTGKGMDEIRADLKRMGIEGDKAEKAMEQLNAELESRAARKQAEDIKAMADQLDGTADKMRAAKKAQEDLNGSLAAAKSSISIGGWTEFASKLTVAKTVMHGLYEGSKKAWEGIRYLSEQGVEGFQSLESAGNSMGKAFIDALKTEPFKTMGESVAVGVDRIAVPAIKNMVSVVGTLGSAVTATTDTLNAMVGVDMSKLRADLAAAATEQAEAAKKLADINLSKKNTAETLAMLARNGASIDEQRAIARLTDEREIREAIADTTNEMKRQATEGKNIGEEDVKFKNKLLALQNQLRKVDDEAFAKRKEQAAEAKRQQEKDLKDKVEAARKAEEEITAIEKKAAEDRWKAAMERMDARKAAEAKSLADHHAMQQQAAKAAAEAQTKMADNLKGNAGAIFSGLDPRKVAQQVGRQREKAAFDQFGREHNREYMDAKNDGDTGAMRRLERQQKEAAARARQQGFRDVKRGNASGDEMIQAQAGLASEVIGNAEATGKVNKAQADALREAANTMSQQQQQLNRLEQDIRATGAQINGLQGRGNNSTNRAQRAGG